MFHFHPHKRRHMRGMFGGDGLGHRRGERGGRGGGRSRMLEQGELRLVLLSLIAEQPSHGYDLIKAIEETTGGTYSPSAGVIYPTLSLLEEMGHATVAAEGGKKLFAATEQGIAEIAANRAQIDAALARLSGGGEGASIAPVMRAMGNLKIALRLRLIRGGLSDERIRAIAAAIDGAAAEVER